ncbi:hypothetical protein Musp01_29670 [Muricauda sp. NBRC 101325]|nr:hypothetical protein Musp01_29670 [Muricauda sp. NBRC 101325]
MKSVNIGNRSLHPISILPNAYLPDYYKIETGTKCKSWGKIGTKNLRQLWIINLPINQNNLKIGISQILLIAT